MKIRSTLHSLVPTTSNLKKQPITTLLKGALLLSPIGLVGVVASTEIIAHKDDIHNTLGKIGNDAKVTSLEVKSTLVKGGKVVLKGAESVVGEFEKMFMPFMIIGCLAVTFMILKK